MASRYFEMFYEDMMNETFEKSVVFNPIVTDYGDRIESVQDFSSHEIKYKVVGTFVPDMKNLANVLHIEFMNVDKNSYELTNDSPSPSEVFGIVFNWTNDYLKDTKHKINHIIVATGNAGDSKKFGKQSRLYMKIIDRFLNIHPEFFKNLDIEFDFNKKKDEYTLFAVSRNDIPEEQWKVKNKPRKSFKRYFNELNNKEN